MSLLVVGSIAYDSIQTPMGSVEEALGGSAVYFSASASFLASVQLLGVVGQDLDLTALDFLKAKGVDLSGLTQKPGKTFRWKGRYGEDLNEAQTLSTELNVFEHFKPQLSVAAQEASHLFLANIHPQLQLDVLDQVKSPKIIAADTMNYWIQGERETLLKVLKRIDLLVINDGEAKLLAQESNVVKASSKILKMGPKAVVIKRGEYGALARTQEGFFYAPAYPLEEVYDPTGAGDTFGGGLMGYLSKFEHLEIEALKQGMILGAVLASFNVERFSVERMKTLTWDEVHERYKAMAKLVHFEPLSL